MHFFSAALAFLSMATLTKHHILRYESYFFVFCVFVYFTKKQRKNDLEMQKAILDPKISPTWSPGTRFGSKNGPEFTSERPKIRKIVKNNRFLPKPFTEHFVARIWAGFWGPSLMDYVDRHRVPRIPAAQYIYRYIYVY